jgi:hypothetical protein
MTTGRQSSVIFLPFAFEASDRKREQQYAAFRGWASECLPHAALPEHFPEKSRFFYFNRRPSWEVNTLQRTSEVSATHPLGEVLVDLQQNWGLLRRKQQTPRWLLLSLLVLGVVLVLVVLIALLASAIMNLGQKPTALTGNADQKTVHNICSVSFCTDPHTPLETPI